MTAPLMKRPLSGTGIEISPIGFGSLAMGGSQWVSGRGEQRVEDSLASARAAVESGVNWIDTAPIYGRGLAEELVGKVLRDFAEADRPLVFTKAGLTWNDDNPLGEPVRVGSPGNIRREIDDSLRRLGVEQIDLYQMHWPPSDEYTVADYWPVFAELRDSGKVRAIGLSNHSVDQMNSAERIAHVDSMQPPFSVLSRDALIDVIPEAARNGTAVLAYAPMESGLLTGAFTEERSRTLPDSDWRKNDPDFVGNGLRKNLTVVDALAAIAARRDVSTSAVAVAWTLACEGVTAAIVGASRPEQVAAWLDAAFVDLTPDELDEVARAIDFAGAGSGPSRPVAGG